MNFKRSWGGVLGILLPLLLLQGTVMGMDNPSREKTDFIAPCVSGSYVPIEDLDRGCGVPGPCGKEMACEGKTALIQGYIDYGNVFDRERYPRLPYQKFLLVNEAGTAMIEVFVEGNGSAAVFEKMRRAQTEGHRKALVAGVLSGFDMPVMNTCRRGLKLRLTGEDSLRFSEP